MGKRSLVVDEMVLDDMVGNGERSADEEGEGREKGDEESHVAADCAENGAASDKDR